METDDATKYTTLCSNLKAERVINEREIDDVFESLYTTIISNMQKHLGTVSCWIIGSVVSHTSNISQ